MTAEEKRRIPRWGPGQLVQSNQSNSYYHVLNRYEDVDDGHVAYRIAGPTHTVYDWVREEDAIAEYDCTGIRLPTGVKPASVFGKRVGGMLLGYNEYDEGGLHGV
jgi:hypothetical protein